MTHIVGSIPAREAEEVELDEESTKKSISYDSVCEGFYYSDGRYIDVKDNAYVVVDDEVYFCDNYRLDLHEASAAVMDRIKDMVSMRNVLRELIQVQVDDRPDIEIKHLQNKLNTNYDKFSKKFGLIASKSNSQAFDMHIEKCQLIALGKTKKISVRT